MRQIFKNCDGKILRRPDDGRVIGDDECCCPEVCESCKSACGTYPTLAAWAAWAKGGAGGLPYARTYKIAQYADGDFTGCSGCPAGAATAWDGTFSAWQYQRCVWGFLATTRAEYAVSGKKVYAGSCAGPDTSYMWLVAIASGWEVKVACDSLFASPIWQGRKTAGCSPVGTYTKHAGCAPLSALSIVADSDNTTCHTTT